MSTYQNFSLDISSIIFTTFKLFCRGMYIADLFLHQYAISFPGDLPGSFVLNLTPWTLPMEELFATRSH